MKHKMKDVDDKCYKKVRHSFVLLITATIGAKISNTETYRQDSIQNNSDRKSGTKLIRKLEWIRLRRNNAEIRKNV